MSANFSTLASSYFHLERRFGNQLGMHPKVVNQVSLGNTEWDTQHQPVEVAQCAERVWVEWIPRDYFVDPFQVRLEQSFEPDAQVNGGGPVAHEMWIVSQARSYSKEKSHYAKEDFIDLEAPVFARTASDVVYATRFSGWKNDSMEESPGLHQWESQFHMRYQMALAKTSKDSFAQKECQQVRFGFPTMYCLSSGNVTLLL
jgi:hypothetical protein